MDSNTTPVINIIIEFIEPPGQQPYPLAGRSGRIWSYCNFDPVRQRVCTRMTLAEFREAREDLFMVPNRRYNYPLIDIEITDPAVASNTVNSEPVASIDPPVVVETTIPTETSSVETPVEIVSPEPVVEPVVEVVPVEVVPVEVPVEATPETLATPEPDASETPAETAASDDSLSSAPKAPRRIR